MMDDDALERLLDQCCSGEVDAIGVKAPRLPWVIYRSGRGWLVDGDYLDAPLEGTLPSLEMQINGLMACGRLPRGFGNALANAVYTRCK